METPNVFSVNSTYSQEQADSLGALVEKAQGGEESAFGELYDLYFKKIYRFVFYRVGHKELAEDLAEDVFMKAYGKIATLTEPKVFEGWLYQIARNLVIDYYRVKRAMVDLQEVENTLEYDTNILNVLHLQERQQVLIKLLHELTPDQQVVIKLKFLEELDNSEIATILGKHEGAIRVIQHRAIAKLQELINKDPRQRE